MATKRKRRRERSERTANLHHYKKKEHEK